MFHAGRCCHAADTHCTWHHGMLEGRLNRQGSSAGTGAHWEKALVSAMQTKASEQEVPCHWPEGSSFCPSLLAVPPASPCLSSAGQEVHKGCHARHSLMDNKPSCRL